MTIDLTVINKRGDENFDSLDEVEKDLYVLMLFVTLHEMEGITHFFSYQHHLRHLPRLLTFLVAIEAPNQRDIFDLAEFLQVKSGGSWDTDVGENERICLA